VSEAKKVPLLRFKGFNEEWEEKKLGDAFGMALSTNTLSRSCLSDCGVVKNIHYGDVLIKLPSVTDVRTTELPFVADDKFKVGAKNLLRDGDIVMADTAEDETAGKVTEVVGISDQKVVSGLHTIVLRPNDDFGMGFLGYCLNAKGFHNELLRIMQGVKVFSVNKRSLEDCRFFSPSVPAQQKLGEVFCSMDALIASRETALEKLKVLKKAMLEKMFPRAGAKVPEVRFKGFEGEWRSYEFSEVYERINAKSYQVQSSEYLQTGDFPVVDQGKDLIIAYSNNKDKVFRAAESPVIVFGDHTREVKFVDFDFVIGADGTQLLRSANFDVRFAYYVMKRVTLPNMGYSRHFKFLLETRYSFPSLPEQRKIGAYFRSLDALISARRDEIAKLKDLKKALLDRMFV